MERLGLSAVAYAEQIWRSAYSGPGAGAKRPEPEKKEMLDRATTVLQDTIHAQFLASLPLAAQLSDGSDGSVNEFQQAKIDQTRVSVTRPILGSVTSSRSRRATSLRISEAIFSVRRDIVYSSPSGSQSSS